jgi:uncharacterized protein with gpF-like domain
MSYYSTYKAIILKVQNAYRPLINACLQEQIDAFIIELKRNPNAIPTDLPTQPLYDALMSMYESGGIAMANVTSKSIKRQVKKDDTEEESLWRWIIRKYYELFLMADIVQPITNTTFNQIKRVLLQAQDEGWGINKMVAALKDSDITRQRAELIVRTESMRASNVGAMIAAAGSSVAVMKQWISAQDKRTRRIPRDQFDHLHMNQVAVGFDQPFVVPSTSSIDAMQYPGDPSGSAGNVCNCRCVVAFVPIRDGQGRPVPVEEYRAQNASEFRQLYLAAQVNRNIFA